MNDEIERYCTIEESLKESLKQMQLMRAGKMDKIYWKDGMEELKKELEKELKQIKK